MSLMLSVIGYLPQFIQQKIIPAMPIPLVENNPSKVQLERLSHVYFEHADLKEFEKFATDFGLVVAQRKGSAIYFRGYGKDPYCYVATKSKDKKPRFMGAAFVAQSQKEFDKAAKIEGAKLTNLNGAPGGGQMITFARSDDTFLHIVYGQVERPVHKEDATAATHDFLGPMNSPFEKPRQGQFQRFHEGPALIHKLGHYGYVCRDFDNEFAFYTNNFNFVPTDILWHPQLAHVDVLAFMHLDLGERYSDHHILFMQRAPPEVKKTYLHHSSFEVADFDTQLIGHEWLAKRGWKSVWGVGRHILGSQIFDYWEDSSRFKIEHYADGDIVNLHTPTRREVAGPISVWGPELPKNFGEDGTQIPL